MAGIDYETATGWREEFKRLFPHILALDPCRGCSPNAEGHIDEQGDITPRHYIERDLKDVRDCDFLFANLLDAKGVSHGSAYEIAYAKALGKPILAVMQDNGNPLDKHFITYSIDYRFNDLARAFNYFDYSFARVGRSETRSGQERSSLAAA